MTDSEEVEGGAVVYDARLYYYRQWAQLSVAVKTAMIEGDLVVWSRASMSLYNHVAPFLDDAASKEILALLESAREHVAGFYGSGGRSPAAGHARGAFFADAEKDLLSAERMLLAEMAKQNMLLPMSQGDRGGKDVKGWVSLGG